MACRTLERANLRCAQIGAGTPCSLDQLPAAAHQAERQAQPSRDDQMDPATRSPCALLIAVPDRAIESTARQLAEASWPPGSVVVHLSGAAPLEVLSPLQDRGLAIGSLHPLKSFVAPPESATAHRDEGGSSPSESPATGPLHGVVCALDGDPAARALTQDWTQRTGATAFPLKAGGRVAWHAAAAHACNHLVALVDQALDLLEAAGLDREQGRAALLPLLSGTVENLAQHSPGQALTGPVVRGDAEVVEQHMRATKDCSADVDAAYRSLAQRALALASRERNLDPRLAARIAATLHGDTP